jgi:hypothetical protein
VLSAHSILGGVIAHVGLMCAAAGAGRAQVELGHKLLGATGIDAGVQAEPGVYILVRAVHFAADEVRDRNGDVVPLRGLDIDAWAGALGAAYVVKLKKALYFSFAVGAPVAKMSLSIDDPRVAIDREGFGDMYALPLKLGWRSNRFDGVASYGVYAPTGQFEPHGGSGVGRGFWTQQISLGGAAFFSEDRAARASALVSYDVNSRKQGIDITRGNTIQVQGGAGIGVGRLGACWPRRVRIATGDAGSWSGPPRRAARPARSRGRPRTRSAARTSERAPCGAARHVRR